MHKITHLLPMPTLYIRYIAAPIAIAPQTGAAVFIAPPVLVLEVLELVPVAAFKALLPRLETLVTSEDA